jgi:alpha-ketoglutarate-dependent taurine dioxygenase
MPAHAEAQAACRLLGRKAILKGDGLAAHDRLAALDRRAASDLLRLRGYVLLRGFARSVADFEALTRRFARRFRVHGNVRRQLVSSDGCTQKVDPGLHALPFHSEMSYGPFYPDTIWFYCAEPSGQGGETTVCDGMAVCRELSADVRRFLRAHRLEYNHRYPLESWSRSIGTTSVALATAKLHALRLVFRRRGELGFHFDAERRLCVRYVTPAFARTRDGDEAFANSLEISYLPNVIELRGGGVSLEGGAPVPPEVLAEVARAASAVGERVPWQRGDVLMIDNSRSMHGRVALAPDGRELYVRLGDRARRYFA